MFLTLGLFLRHPGMIVLSVPCLLMVIISIGASAGSPLSIHRDKAVLDGASLRIPISWTEDPPGGSGALEMIMVDVPGESGELHLVSPTSQPAEIGTINLTQPRSGRLTIGRITRRSVGADGLTAADWTKPTDVETLVWPHAPVRRMPAPVPGRLARNPGSHRSRLAGSGSDPKDIRPLTPSDSLRDVDWRATARSPRPDELLVRERYAENQGTVRLVVDTGEDLAWNPVTWFYPYIRTVNEASLLGSARVAAIAVATLHVRSGDRVGMSQLNDGGVPVPAATGNRQLDRLRAHLANLGESTWRRPWRRIVSPPQPGSLVYVLSGFMDPLSVERALQWAQHGHRVIAVDVGTPLDRLSWPVLDSMTGFRNPWIERWLHGSQVPRLTAEQARTSRLTLALRRAHLSELRHANLELITWTNADAVGMALGAMDRRRQAVRRRG